MFQFPNDFDLFSFENPFCAVSNSIKWSIHWTCSMNSDYKKRKKKERKISNCLPFHWIWILRWYLWSVFHRFAIFFNQQHKMNVSNAKFPITIINTNGLDFGWKCQWRTGHCYAVWTVPKVIVILSIVCCIVLWKRNCLFNAIILRKYLSLIFRRIHIKHTNHRSGNRLLSITFFPISKFDFISHFSDSFAFRMDF